MENDFGEHLDTARLWWDLDEAVLVAISEGSSTRGPFREIALYVLDLKRRHEGADEAPALAKIAVRIAASPELSREQSLDRRPPVSRPIARKVAVAALLTLAFAALFTAAAAANLIPVPDPVRTVLDRIGIETKDNDRDSIGSLRRSPRAEAAAPALDAVTVPSIYRGTTQAPSSPTRAEIQVGQNTEGEPSDDAAPAHQEPPASDTETDRTRGRRRARETDRTSKGNPATVRVDEEEEEELADEDEEGSGPPKGRGGGS